MSPTTFPIESASLKAGIITKIFWFTVPNVEKNSRRVPMVAGQKAVPAATASAAILPDGGKQSRSLKNTYLHRMEAPLKIDIHTHILPEKWPDLKEKYGYGGFVRLDHHKPCCARMMMD
ncbi:MAG TPA: hypothetical protein VHS96_07375, partial [Bacteroidia bacterium]|nr:hypothetical protein [Bacteroidia bacterium]